MEQIEADHAWLREQGAELGQWGPDPTSGKVRVYLAHYSEEARQLLTDRYGEDIVVDTQSRQFCFPESRAESARYLRDETPPQEV